MTVRKHRLGRNEDGASAVEIAIALPVLIFMIYGIFTLGLLFEANAGIQHALGEGARRGNLCLNAADSGCTLPTKTSLSDLVNSKLYGTTNGTFDTPNVDTSTANSGYVTITVDYHVTPNFLFVTAPRVNLERAKRVYLADTPPTQSDCETVAAAHTSDPSKPSASLTCEIYK